MGVIDWLQGLLGPGDIVLPPESGKIDPRLKGQDHDTDLDDARNVVRKTKSGFESLNKALDVGSKRKK